MSDLSAGFGLVLDPWQDEVLRAAMGERADGRWTAPRVGLSAPRQNGKSQLIVARALAGALLFGERKIVISAHQADTARETFGKFLELIEECPALEARLLGGSVAKGVMNAINREFIRFRNGAKIQFKARTGAGGRGFSSDCLFLDEAQILSARAWTSINSTMSARPNPQVWLMGTPPRADDDGGVFTNFRDAAMASKTPMSAFLEWSADPGDDPALESTRAKANPAWYTRINKDVVQGEFETYSREDFALERLGIWRSDAQLSIFPGWSDLADDSVPMGDHRSVALAVDVSSDLSYASIGAAGARSDGLLDVAVDYHRGTQWVASRLSELVTRYGSSGPVWLMGRNAATLAGDLEALDVPVVVASLADKIAACAALHTAVSVDPAVLRHQSQEPLNAAVAGAKWSSAPDGRVLDRRHATADVGPLYAVAGALLGLSTASDYDVLDSVW